MEADMNKKQIVKYLLFVFITAYAIQIPASIFTVKHPDTFGLSVFQVSIMVVMFTPFFGALFAKGNFKGIGFKPKFKGCAYLIPLCFFGPQIIAALGAVLFYLIFPDMFDLSGSYMQSSLNGSGDFIKILESQGISYPVYAAIVILQSVTYAPIINMLLALGEEVGWRGFLYPELNKGMGKVPTWLLGGIIWGAFHFPAMVISGYEYGTEYFGFPIVGMIIFCIFTILLGLIIEIVYDKTKCIWYPALLHGAVNAGNFVILFYNVNDVDKANRLTIFGPGYNGLIGGIPFAVIAIVLAVIVLKKKKANDAVK